MKPSPPELESCLDELRARVAKLEARQHPDWTDQPDGMPVDSPRGGTDQPSPPETARSASAETARSGGGAGGDRAIACLLKIVEIVNSDGNPEVVFADDGGGCALTVRIGNHGCHDHMGAGPRLAAGKPEDSRYVAKLVDELHDYLFGHECEERGGATSPPDAGPGTTVHGGGAGSYGPGRCEICGWTLHATPEAGCTPGSCSYRPDEPNERRRIQERRDAIGADRLPPAESSGKPGELPAAPPGFRVVGRSCRCWPPLNPGQRILDADTGKLVEHPASMVDLRRWSDGGYNILEPTAAPEPANRQGEPSLSDRIFSAVKELKVALVVRGDDGRLHSPSPTVLERLSAFRALAEEADTMTEKLAAAERERDEATAKERDRCLRWFETELVWCQMEEAIRNGTPAP